MERKAPEDAMDTAIATDTITDMLLIMEGKINKTHVAIF